MSSVFTIISENTMRIADQDESMPSFQILMC